MEDIIIQQTQISEIIDLVEYSEDSPSCLIWTKDFGKGRFIRRSGGRVGNITKYPAPSGRDQFYWKFGYKQKSYTNHRVIWALFNGDIPKGLVINHIDNNSLNNKISNLEVVTTKENNQKTYYHNGISLKDNNNSGVLGVSDCIREQCGVLFYYAQARYRDENSRGVQRYFRYDPDDAESKINAYALAKSWRDTNIKLLVEKGLAYYQLKEEEYE